MPCIKSSPMDSSDPRFRSRLIVCFAIVYLVWGSSYLATKLGVQDLPPMLFAGIRFVVAGAGMWLFARSRGARLPREAAQWRHLIWMAFLAVVIANGFNVWGLQWVPSGQAALLNVSVAFWIPIFGLFGARAHSIGLRVGTGLALGFIGTLLIVWPDEGVSTNHLVPQLGILVGCVGWAAGANYLRTAEIKLDILSFTALQMLIGGVMLTAYGAALGEFSRWTWTVRGIGTMLYLTIFSSCLAYTAFAWLAQNAAPSRVATYAYVNPVVATLLGWMVLDETLTAAQLTGMVVILAGVLLVNWPDPAAPPPTPTVQDTG